MIKLLPITLLLLIFHYSFAQKKDGSITGVLIDSANHKTSIEFATASVYNATDNKLIAFKLSDPKGQFRLSGLEFDKPFVLVISAFGYTQIRKELTITPQNPTLDLGTFYMPVKSNLIQEVVVTAQIPPIVVRHDTIEFNAESFKVLPTAVVEDLLKKLPGIMISGDGNIIYNGRSVSRIMVDGKEFFGGDVQIASKNLPANIVDKVQVTDDKDVKRRNPDIMESQLPQVINLKLKKWVKQGAFGKVYGGGGTSRTYEAGGILNVFRDTSQISILGFGNNINKAGFSLTDVQRIGGFGRSGEKTTSTGDDGGFALGSISFGGVGSGIQKILGSGVNFNTIPKKDVTLNMKYFLGRVNSIVNQTVNEQQSIGSGQQTSLATVSSDNTSTTHTIGGKLKWDPNRYVEATFTPTIVYNPVSFFNNQEKNSFGNAGQLNASTQHNDRKYRPVTVNIAGDLVKDFKKPGRTMLLAFTAQSRSDNQHNYNYSNSVFYNPSSTATIDQLRNSTLSNTSFSATGSYTEPLSKKFSISISVDALVLKNENNLFTFYKNPVTANYDVPVPDFSQTVEQTGTKTNSQVKFKWTINRQFSIQPLIGVNTIALNDDFSTAKGIKQNFTYFYPGVNLRLNKVSVSFSSTIREPDVQYIQPTPNNTDPLLVVNGNPSLSPSRTQRININYFNFDRKRNLNYSWFLYGGAISNDIIMSKTITSNGVQINMPVNVDGTRSIGSNGTISKLINSMGKQLTLNIGYYGVLTHTPIQVNGLQSNADILSATPNAGFRINLNDKIEFFDNYNVTFSSGSYHDPSFQNYHLATQFNDSELILRYIKKLVFECNYKLQLTSQNLPGYNNDIKLLNAGATFLFLKNDRAQLKFSANDILQNNVKRYAYVIENISRDVQTNNIGRYFLLTFTYNIQNFGQKIGGKERFLGF